jgi:hypothetical protein
VESPQQNNLRKAGTEEDKLRNSSENMLKLSERIYRKLLKNVTIVPGTIIAPFWRIFNKSIFICWHKTIILFGNIATVSLTISATDSVPLWLIKLVYLYSCT